MKRLTSHARDKVRKVTRRLQAAGIPVVETKKNQEPAVLIRQDFEAYESMIFDANGGAGIIIPLTITSEAPTFVFARFHIALHRWANAWFRPLEENDGGEWPHYDFYGRSELKFDRNDTINRFIAERKEFPRGHAVHGLLLAFSYDRMPDDIILGQVLGGSIKIYDQFEHDCSARISLRVQQREAERVLKPNPRRSRLFSRPDFKSPL